MKTLFIKFIYLFLLSYNCLHFLPFLPPHPSQSHLPPPPLPSPLILSLFKKSVVEKNLNMNGFQATVYKAHSSKIYTCTHTRPSALALRGLKTIKIVPEKLLASWNICVKSKR